MVVGVLVAFVSVNSHSQSGAISEATPDGSYIWRYVVWEKKVDKLLEDSKTETHSTIKFSSSIKSR